MVKLAKHQKVIDSSDSDQEDQILLKNKPPQHSDSDDEENDNHSYEEVDSDIEIAIQDEHQPKGESDEELGEEEVFGQRGINNEARMLERLAEIQANFYNRLSSKKLINNTRGRIPFSEHMTISKFIINVLISLYS